ncbi:hypothetical protein FKP32DRAFT_1597544 [Trametes sanguinea]|nr:hypothetical protein FKP32DRAFT_1597544 [Trametes sanguinea]
MASHRSRYLSTPVPPPDQQKVPPPTSATPRPPPPAPSQAQEDVPSQYQHADPSTPGPSSPSEDAKQHGTSSADAIARIREHLRELTHDAVKQTRERGDQFTALKRRVVEQEGKIHQARETARQAKEAYDRAVLQRAQSQREAWSDKIRSASTYGSLAAIALNVVVFVLAIVLVEPWKRRRLAQTFERKVEEMSAATAAAFESKAEELKTRMDEQGKLLALVLETVHLTSQVSNAELAALGVTQEEGAASAEATEPPTSRRIPAFAQPEQELLIAATASAVAAGLLGWLARSWFG